MIKEWWKEQEVAHSTAWRMTVLAESLVSKNNNQWKQLNSDITKSFSISEVYIFTEYVSGSSHHANAINLWLYSFASLSLLVYL